MSKVSKVIKKEKFKERQKLVYVADTNEGSLKLKQKAALLLMFAAILGSSSYTFYLIYQFIQHKSIKSLYILLMAQFHSSCIAGPSKWMYKFMEYFECLKWFDKLTIISEEKIRPEKSLFAWMPHNIICYPVHFAKYNPKSPFYDSITLGSRMAVDMPFFGSFAKMNGTSGVNPENFKDIMCDGKNINFVPGGFEEATITSNKEYRLWINNRKGFIKYAIEFGYRVHPVFVFNENKGYKTSDLLLQQRIKLNKFKLPSVMFFSKYFVFPENNIEIGIVIGEHLELPIKQNPTEEEVDYYHNQYMDAVVKLFNRHVDQFDPGAKLKLWGEVKPQPKPKL